MPLLTNIELSSIHLLGGDAFGYICPYTSKKIPGALSLAQGLPAGQKKEQALKRINAFKVSNIVKVLGYVPIINIIIGIVRIVFASMVLWDLSKKSTSLYKDIQQGKKLIIRGLLEMLPIAGVILFPLDVGISIWKHRKMSSKVPQKTLPQSLQTSHVNQKLDTIISIIREKNKPIIEHFHNDEKYRVKHIFFSAHSTELTAKEFDSGTYGTTKYYAKMMRSFLDQTKGKWSEEIETNFQEAINELNTSSGNYDLLQIIKLDCEKRSPKEQLSLIAEYYANQIKMLQPKQSLLLKCGIRVHAVTLEITKESDGRFSVMVINTGSGLEHHVPSLRIVNPLTNSRNFLRFDARTLKYKDIIEEKFDKAFFESLLSLSVGYKSHESLINYVQSSEYNKAGLDEGAKKENVSMTDFYRTFKTHFKTSPKYGHQYKDQIGGSCSVRSITTWIHNRMKKSDELEKAYLSFVLFELEEHKKLLSNPEVKKIVESGNFKNGRKTIPKEKNVSCLLEELNKRSLRIKNKLNSTSTIKWHLPKL